MALPSLEIRYKKSVLYFILSVSVFLFIGMTGMLFTPDSTRAGFPLYGSYFLSLIVLGLAGYFLYKRYSDKTPVLIFMSDGLRMPRKKDRFIPWGAITEWKISRQKSTEYLVIRTASGKTRIDISWLELPSKGIVSMMETYIRQPGPGGFLR